MEWEHLRREELYNVVNLPETKSGMEQDVRMVGLVMDALADHRDELTVCGRDEVDLYIGGAGHQRQWVDPAGPSVSSSSDMRID